MELHTSKLQQVLLLPARQQRVLEEGVEVTKKQAWGGGAGGAIVWLKSIPLPPGRDWADTAPNIQVPFLKPDAISLTGNQTSQYFSLTGFSSERTASLLL